MNLRTQSVTYVLMGVWQQVTGLNDLYNYKYIYINEIREMRIILISICTSCSKHQIFQRKQKVKLESIVDII